MVLYDRIRLMKKKLEAARVLAAKAIKFYPYILRKNGIIQKIKKGGEYEKKHRCANPVV